MARRCLHIYVLAASDTRRTGTEHARRSRCSHALIEVPTASESALLISQVAENGRIHHGRIKSSGRIHEGRINAVHAVHAVHAVRVSVIQVHVHHRSGRCRGCGCEIGISYRIRQAMSRHVESAEIEIKVANALVER